MERRDAAIGVTIIAAFSCAAWLVALYIYAEYQDRVHNFLGVLS